MLQRIAEAEAARNKQRTEQANKSEATNLAEEVRNVRPKQSAVQDSTRAANEPPGRHLNDPELVSARVPVKRPQPGTPGAGAAAGSEVKARKTEGPANEVTVESSSSPFVDGGAKRHAADRSKEDEAAAKQPRIHTALPVSTRRGFKEWVMTQARSDGAERKRGRMDECRNNTDRIQRCNGSRGKGVSQVQGRDVEQGCLPMTAKAEFEALISSMRSA